MIAAMGCDVLVIGHGAAGCLAASALAGKGPEVILVGRGTTATELSTGRISLPGGPERRLAELCRSVGEGHGLYLSDVGRTDAITNLGTVASQDLTSPHDWLVSSGGRVAVLGLRGNLDLDPDLVCRSLASRLPSLVADPYWTDPGLPEAIDAGRGVLSEEAKEAVDLLGGVLAELEQDTVVLPPLFSGPLYNGALTRLERACGREVREPATPMSIPGRRLQACLESHAVRSGCCLLKEREVSGLLFDGDRASTAIVHSGLREQTIGFRAAVWAAGGVVGGGLTVSGEDVVDPLGVFAVGTAMVGGVLTSALSSGILHRDGWAVRSDGSVVKNVVVAGSSLPGISYPLGCGLGEVVSSALDAAAMAEEAL
jgi:anaerobic glycerol-3-phosphate dehydrogenase